MKNEQEIKTKEQNDPKPLPPPEKQAAAQMLVERRNSRHEVKPEKKTKNEVESETKPVKEHKKFSDSNHVSAGSSKTAEQEAEEFMSSLKEVDQ